MINPMELTGKQILVAGATSEIGQAIVTQLRQLGAKVVMLDNSEEKLLEIQKNPGSMMYSLLCFRYI